MPGTGQHACHTSGIADNHVWGSAAKPARAVVVAGHFFVPRASCPGDNGGRRPGGHGGRRPGRPWRSRRAAARANAAVTAGGGLAEGGGHGGRRCGRAWRSRRAAAWPRVAVTAVGGPGERGGQPVHCRRWRSGYSKIISVIASPRPSSRAGRTLRPRCVRRPRRSPAWSVPEAGLGSSARVRQPGERAQVRQALSALDPPVPFLADRGGEADHQRRFKVLV